MDIIDSDTSLLFYEAKWLKFDVVAYELRM